jgi:hypothetical protein
MTQLNLIQFTLVEAGDQQYLTVVVAGNLMPPIDDSHQNFDLILSIVEDPEGHYGEPLDADDLADLAEKFDISETVAKKFDKLSERVTVANGVIYFDGDPIDGTIVETILRFLNEGKEDFKPLVNYIEKIASNPEKHSRYQLYDWLKLHETISITPEGDLIAYKGVSPGGTHPETGEDCYQSGFTGTATVDGITITGHIPNYVGAEVTMPRSQVAHDPSTACHTGLHVGTFDYARGYSHGGAMLAVRVNPRDVVSVPTDGGGAKIRVCRYIVEEIIQAPLDGVLVDQYSGDSDGTAEAVTDVVLDTPQPSDALKVGDLLVDSDGDEAEVTTDSSGALTLEYTDEDYGFFALDGAKTLSELNAQPSSLCPWARV